MQEKICSVTKEKYTVIKHKTGVNIVISYRPDYSTSYTLFAAKYGSMNTVCYSDDNKEIKIPDGTAHFLEHKLFENENEDAFTLYAQTGADANAYTTFDKTAYLFSCSDGFERSLEILLDFVQSPYFTEDSIAKEQGIIGQEIKMYEDNPGARVFRELMTDLFINNTVAIDTAGTVESIAEITPQLLFDCYNTFYNPKNMVLVVCGPQKSSDVLEICDKLLKERPTRSVPLQIANEPPKANKPYSEINLAVDMPLFALGFKDASGAQGIDAVKQAAQTEILLELLIGKSSDLYEKLYASGDINAKFEYEYMYGNGYGATILSGISQNPGKVRDSFTDAADNLKNNGISNEDFLRAKNLIFGKNLRSLNDPDFFANLLLDLAILNVDLEEYMKTYNEITLEECKERLSSHFNVNAMALSVVNPYKREEK